MNSIMTMIEAGGENLNALVLTILSVASAIITLGGATAVIQRWWKESKMNQNQERINKLEDRTDAIEKELHVQGSHQKETDDFTKTMCSAMLALLDHNITGNSVDKLKKAKEELQDFLVNK